MKRCLDDTGLPLGWQAGSEYPVTRVPLTDGDLLVLLTDGIEEAMDPDGSQSGQRRVLDLLQTTRNLPVSEIVGSLHEAVRDFHDVASRPG